MPDPFVIEIDDRPVLEALNRLQAAAGDLTPAMRAIAGLLESQTEDNFAAQSGPAGKWPALKPSTLTKRRGENARILQDKGRLAAAAYSGAGSDAIAAWIGIGADPVYAAIQQLGGQAGHQRKVTLPPRPYLPFLGNQLQAGLRDEVLEKIQDYILQATKI